MRELISNNKVKSPISLMLILNEYEKNISEILNSNNEQKNIFNINTIDNTKDTSKVFNFVKTYKR